MLNDYDNKQMKTNNTNPHSKIYYENERDMLDHGGNAREKEHSKSYIVHVVVVPEKMQCAAFVGGM